MSRIINKFLVKYRHFSRMSNVVNIENATVILIRPVIGQVSTSDDRQTLNRLQSVTISGPDAELGGGGGAQPSAVRDAEQRKLSRTTVTTCPRTAAAKLHTPKNE